MAGICTTSRVESLHNTLKDYLTSNSRLIQVFYAFKKIESIQIDKFINEYNNGKEKKEGKFSDGHLMAELRKTITPYALKKVERRLNNVISYTIQDSSKFNSW